MYKYAVIGGQYQQYCYGFAKTLHAAKCLATKHIEYWDNRQGWHYPAIYSVKDVTKCENFFGPGYCSKCGTAPVATRKYGENWSVTE